nr:uncharacterized protein LOC109423101 [Aedes albopictus]XP_029722768.1 uncharacterized protein LOC109423101 [Aedes albopictus]
MVTTWELAVSHARALTNDNTSTQVSSIRSLTGGRGAVLQRIADLARGRGPVKSRLGYRPHNSYNRYNGRANHRSPTKQVRFQDQHHRYRDASVRPAELKGKEQQAVIDQRVCSYCGARGHVRRKCFKLKHYQEDQINSIDMEKPGPSSGIENKLSNMMNRFSWEDDSEESDQDYDWKRANNNSTSEPN